MYPLPETTKKKRGRKKKRKIKDVEIMSVVQNKKYPETFRCILATMLLLAAATGIGWLFRSIGFPETNIVIVYLLSVLLIARATHGFSYGIAASFIAIFAFNFFFTEPYYTFKVNNATYFITFTIMVITALITSALTSRVKQNAVIALEKEAETSALYQFTNLLTDAKDISDIGSITIEAISKIASCNASFFPFDESGMPEPAFIQQKAPDEQIHRSVEGNEVLKYEMDHLKSLYYMDDEFCDWPVYGRDAILGMVRIPKEYVPGLSEAQIHLLHSMIECSCTVKK